MARTALALRLLLPAFLIGAIVAISFLEAPLKFQAPGITIPLGLGIGRLVFTALNILTGVALAVLTLVSLRRPRAGRTSLVLLGAIWLVYLVEVAAIRPVLNRRSDLVLAGSAAPGTEPRTAGRGRRCSEARTVRRRCGPRGAGWVSAC